MTKKDVWNLLAPSLLFAGLAVSALFFAGLATKYTGANRAKESEEKFETFIKNVETGKWQLTPDRWIHGMRLYRASANSDREIITVLADFMQFSGWVGLFAVLYQVAIVFALRAKSKNILPKSLQRLF